MYIDRNNNTFFGSGLNNSFTYIFLFLFHSCIDSGMELYEQQREEICRILTFNIGLHSVYRKNDGRSPKEQKTFHISKFSLTDKPNYYTIRISDKKFLNLFAICYISSGNTS